MLKPGEIVLIYKSLQSVAEETDKALVALEQKLLSAGFLEAQVVQLKSVSLSGAVQPFGVKAKKPSWKIGSSFAINRSMKSPVQVWVDDDLIDEDSLLTQEDLEKPQLLAVGDCEVGSTRNACKNCTCGRADAEGMVKLGLTTDKLNKPQSACGNASLPGNFLAADI